MIGDIFEDKATSEKLNSIFTPDFFNLQRFADGGTDDDDDENDEPDTLDENKEQDGDNDSGDDTDNDDDDSDPLSKKLQTLEQLNAINVEKYETIEEELGATKSELSKMASLLEKVVGAISTDDDEDDEGSKKKNKNTNKKPKITDTRTDEILLKKIRDLEKREKQRNEQDYIREQIKDKPWLKEQVKTLNITTKNKFIETIIPMEDFLKEAYDNKRRLEENSNRDIVGDYGYVNRKPTSRNKKRIEEANQIGASIIDDILD